MRSLLQGIMRVAVAAMILAAGAPAMADTAVSFAANDTDFLNMMGNLEGPRGFGSIYDGAPALPVGTIDAMSIRDVLSYQRSIRAMGTASSAVGRYQFIYVTLDRLVKDLGISGDIVFDGEVQTFLARRLMADCGFYDVDTPVTPLGNCLAGVWAALPRLSGPGRGQSVYAGDGLNASLVAPERLETVLSDRFTW